MIRRNDSLYGVEMEKRQEIISPFASNSSFIESMHGGQEGSASGDARANKNDRNDELAEEDSLNLDTASIVILGLVTFVGDAARGLVYPALWPLCRLLGGNAVDLCCLLSLLCVLFICFCDSSFLCVFSFCLQFIVFAISCCFLRFQFFF